MSIVAAASHPDRVAGLFLYAPSARLLEDDGYDGDTEELLPLLGARLSTLWGTDDRSNVAQAMPSMAHDARWRAGWAPMQRRSCTPGAAAQYWVANALIDVREMLPLVRVPTRVVHCSCDAVTPVAHGRYVFDERVDPTNHGPQH